MLYLHFWALCLQQAATKTTETQTVAELNTSKPITVSEMSGKDEPA